MKKVEFRNFHEFSLWFRGWVEGKKKLTGPELEYLKEMMDTVPQAPSPTVQALPPKLAATNPEPQPRPVMSKGQAMSAGP